MTFADQVVDIATQLFMTNGTWVKWK